jgi:hypothetical protein
MEGWFDLESGVLAMHPLSWIKRPLFFAMVGMKGISKDGGMSFSGRIDSPGCGRFRITKVSAGEISEDAAWFSAAPRLNSTAVFRIRQDLERAKIDISASLFKDYYLEYTRNTDSFTGMLSAVQQGGDVPAITNLIVAAEPYRRKGLTVSQAVYYSSHDINYNDIPEFNAKKRLYDARKQKAYRQCNDRVSNDDITDMSPFAVQGKCFYIASAEVSQWISQSSALVADFGLYLDFLGMEQKSMIRDVIVMGEAPYSYEATSGAALTVPRARVLMHIDKKFEIPDPPESTDPEQ